MDVITSHENADFDCFGAMVAAKRLYPEAELVFSGAREPALRDFFVKSSSGGYDFRRVRDIDLDSITRLILVDVRQVDRIGPFGDVARRSDVEIHIYDHHPGGDDHLNGTVEHIEPVGSSVTVLTHLFIARQITPTPEDATLMMLGLYEDTGSLTFNSTCEKDYQAAAFLLRCGARLNLVADFLIQELTSHQVGLLNTLIQNCKPVANKGVTVMVSQASIDHYIGDLAMLVHKLKDMENYNALLVAVRMGDRVFMVGRSRIPEVDVGAILREFGGGGHDYAASATVKEQPLAEVFETLQQVIRRRVSPLDVARRIMSYPVKTIDAKATVAEARALLTRYTINAAPVFDDGRMVGVVSRQETERAAHHKLEALHVEEVMSRDFTVATPESRVPQLQNLIVRHEQRFVPVMDQDELVGVVTRTDLLRHMVHDERKVNAVDGELELTEPVLKRRQLARMLRSDLPRPLVDKLMQLGSMAEKLGVHAYLVGGFVRDLVLRRRNLDIDVVVEGDGIAFAEAFARAHQCRIRAHPKFQTAVIIFPDEFKVDVASARMEYYDHPGALPEVEYSSIKLDLYRRDFTINTLALSLDVSRFGELLDFFGALNDLRHKTLRVLHSLSFVEDPTRVFRAIRFEQRLGFQMGAQTEFLLSNAVKHDFLGRLGGPRVLNELKAILSEPNPVDAVERLAEFNLLTYLHPRLALTSNVRALFSEIERTLHWFELLFTGQECRRWLVYLIGLTWDADLETVEMMGKHLGMSPRDILLIGEQADEGHQLVKRFGHFARIGRPFPNSDLERALEKKPLELILVLVAAAETEAVRQQISHYLTYWRHEPPLLNGEDLKRLGFPPGPMYRQVFSALRAAQLDGKIETTEEAEVWVKQRMNEDGQKAFER